MSAAQRRANRVGGFWDEVQAEADAQTQDGARTQAQAQAQKTPRKGARPQGQGHVVNLLDLSIPKSVNNYKDRRRTTNRLFDGGLLRSLKSRYGVNNEHAGGVQSVRSASTIAASGYNLGPGFWERAPKTAAPAGDATFLTALDDSAFVEHKPPPLAVRLSRATQGTTTAAGILATPRNVRGSPRKLPPLLTPGEEALRNANAAATPRVLVSPRPHPPRSAPHQVERQGWNPPAVVSTPANIHSPDEPPPEPNPPPSAAGSPAMIDARTVGNYVVLCATAANPYRPHTSSLRWGVGNEVIAAAAQQRAEEEAARLAAEAEAEAERRRREAIEAQARERERREVLERASATSGASTTGRPSSIADGVKAIVKAAKMRSKSVQTVDTEDLFANLPKEVAERIRGLPELAELQALLANAQPDDVPRIFRRAGEVVASLVGADRSSVFLVDRTDPARHTLWTLAPIQSALGQDVAHIRIPVASAKDPEKPHGLAGWCAMNGKGRLIKDAYDQPEFDQSFDKKTGYRTRSVLTAPIRATRGLRQVEGVIQCINKLQDPAASKQVVIPFTDDDLALVSAIASFLAKGFDGVHARRKEAAFDALLSTIDDVGRYDAAAPTVRRVSVDDSTLFEDGDERDEFSASANGIAMAMQSTLATAMMCERSNFFAVDPVACEVSGSVEGYVGAGVVRYPLRMRGRWMTAATPRERVTDDGDDAAMAKAGFAVRCVMTGEPIVAHDASSDKYYDEKVDLVTGNKTRTVLCMPLFGRAGNVIACFEFVNKRGIDSYSFTDSDVRLCATFAKMASTVMQRDELERELSRAHRLERRITSALSNMTTELDMLKLVERLVLDIRGVVGCEWCALWLWDNLRKNLEREEPVARLALDGKDGVAVRQEDEEGVPSSKTFGPDLGELGKEPGTGDDWFTAVPRISADLGVLGHVARTTATVNLRRAEQDERFCGDKALTKALLTIPLTGPNGETVGVLQCSNKTMRNEAEGREVADDACAFSEDAVTIASRLAGAAGIILSLRLNAKNSV